LRLGEAYKLGAKTRFMKKQSKPVKLLTGGNPQIAKADGRDAEFAESDS
jgi:hypothetical protein